jgi:hypothetical protein
MGCGADKPGRAASPHETTYWWGWLDGSGILEAINRWERLGSMDRSEIFSPEEMEGRWKRRKMEDGRWKMVGGRW